ncbi:transposase [Shinella sp. DD12]|nr:transposase [Shinella sp. DD12]
MCDELLNESLFFGLDHARSAMAEWADDVNHFRPHSSLGYQAPADYAGSIAATGSNAAQDESFAFPSVAPTVPLGVVRIDQNDLNPSNWTIFWSAPLGVDGPG